MSNKDTTELRAREFMLKRHKLFFENLDNLTVGSNFIHSAADFANAERATIADELEDYFESGDGPINELGMDAYIEQLRQGQNK